MGIKHHLSQPILMAYSAGTLPEAFNLVVATHISMCDECRAALESYDAVGGSVLEACDHASLDDDAFEATLALIASGADHGKEPIRVRSTTNAVFPGPLQDYVGGDLDAVKWRAAGGGVRQAILSTSKDATVRLIRIPAGASVPDHGHRGTELTLVLQGAFRDESDRFGRGDVEVANEDMHHTPVAEEGADCICLAATDAPLKFNGLIPRIAQPFLRI
jgi:putative transcriptional regulator